MKKADLIFGFLALPVDFSMFIAAGAAAYFLRISPWVANIRPVLFYHNLPPLYYTTIVTVAAFFFVAIFAVSGLYALGKRRSILGEMASVTIAVSAGMMFVILIMFFQREWFDSRFILLAAWGFALTL